MPKSGMSFSIIDFCSGGIRQFKNFNKHLPRTRDHRRRVILSGIGIAADVYIFQIYPVIVFFIL
jgi:hypothetical protein